VKDVCPEGLARMGVEWEEAEGEEETEGDQVEGVEKESVVAIGLSGGAEEGVEGRAEVLHCLIHADPPTLLDSNDEERQGTGDQTDTTDDHKTDLMEGVEEESKGKDTEEDVGKVEGETDQGFGEDSVGLASAMKLLPVGDAPNNTEDAGDQADILDVALGEPKEWDAKHCLVKGGGTKPPEDVGAEHRLATRLIHNSLEFEIVHSFDTATTHEAHELKVRQAWHDTATHQDQTGDGDMTDGEEREGDTGDDGEEQGAGQAAAAIGPVASAALLEAGGDDLHATEDGADCCGEQHKASCVGGDRDNRS
jgi:hypothetical protein